MLEGLYNLQVLCNLSNLKESIDITHKNWDNEKNLSFHEVLSGVFFI